MFVRNRTGQVAIWIGRMLVMYAILVLVRDSVPRCAVLTDIRISVYVNQLNLYGP